MNYENITFGEEILNQNDVVISKSTYDKITGDFVAKSFKCESRALWTFPNEILTYWLIWGNENDKKKESDKKMYFSEFVGFIFDEENKHPYFGTIVMKWYNMGDLFRYANEIKHEMEKRNEIKESSKKKCLNFSRAHTKQSKKEIKILLDLANQIATGKTINKYIEEN